MLPERHGQAGSVLRRRDRPWKPPSMQCASHRSCAPGWLLVPAETSPCPDDLPRQNNNHCDNGCLADIYHRQVVTSAFNGTMCNVYRIITQLQKYIINKTHEYGDSKDVKRLSINR